MADVMLTVMPFAGHVTPFLKAADAFVAAGHTVRVYSGSAYAEAFAARGVEVVRWQAAPDFDEHALAETFPEAGRAGPRGLLANVEHVFIRSAAAQVTDLRGAWAQRPWDVLVCDSLSLGGALAAEALGTPYATLSVVPLTLPSRDLPPPLTPIPRARGPLGRIRDRVLWLLVDALSAGLRRAYRSTRSAIGLDPKGKSYKAAFHSPFLIAGLGLPELEEPRSDLPPQVHFVGTFPLPSGLAPHPSWWADATGTGRPLVHVTQGTYDIDPEELLRPALSALDGRPVTVVAATGVRHRDSLPFAVPTNTFVAGFVPYVELLPRLSVMITNAGWGGTLAALAHGVPLIMAGSDLDKPMVAAAVARAGAGIDLRTGRPTPAAIGGALDRIAADPSYRAAAQHLAARFARHDTAAELIGLVERLIATGRPVLRDGDPWA